LTDLSRRFAGLDRLYGAAQGEAVRRAHVVVVGIGGVGSWAAECLARSGVGRLTLIDMDHVAESNINRQVQALSSTIGLAKVIAMRQRIEEINPVCDVRMIDDFVTPQNWLELLPKGIDAVIDCCDQVQAKIAMANWARMVRTPFVSVGAAGGKRLAHQVNVADLCEVTHDPLLAKMRYALRRQHDAPKNGKKIGVVCVFSREPVQPPVDSCDANSDSTLNCHGYGSSMAVTATFGLCASGWVIDKLANPTHRTLAS
jgi:tRNA A37 threonylcarbamoyladenosine dehydratase